MQTVKILIVDDHRLVREGLRSMLESREEQYKFLIEEVESGEEGIEKIRIADYDIILMDYQLPKLNGAETAREMLIYKANLNILGLSSYTENLYVKNMMKAGAKGYILKDIDADELIKAITTIMKGKNYYSNDVAVQLINVNEDASDSIRIPSGEKLSTREFEVLRLIAEAYTSKQIADKLFLSKKTIDKYRQHLLEKMNVNNTVDLLKHATMFKLL